MSYLEKHGGTLETPQSEPMRPDQVENSAGGFVWAVDAWTRLRRFLVLGSEGGSYYATERTLTLENATVVRELAASDGELLVSTIVEMSDAGRAPSNDPALYALATAISHGDAATKRAAAEALPKVARTATHLYHFVAFAQSQRGWGPTLRWAVANWYASMHVDKLAYQAVKYRQRDGWTHRDLLRLAHPVPPSSEHNALFAWMAGKASPDPLPEIVLAFAEAQASTSPAATAALVRQHRLPREALLPEHLNDPDVWRAMLETDMPVMALTRNLATMTRLGVLEGDYRRLVMDALGDEEKIRRSRMHPLAFLVALRTYAAGHGFRGQNTWIPQPKIVDALDAAFYVTGLACAPYV